MSDPMTSTTAPVQQNYATDGTTISAAALATRIAALEAQIALAQRDNTKLIARIVELEHQLETASGLIIRYARLVGSTIQAAREAEEPTFVMDSVSSFPSPRAPEHDAEANHFATMARVMASHTLEQERDSARRWAAAWRRSARRNRGALDTMLAGYERDKARIVELEHERDRAMLVVATAVSLVSRAEGLADMLGGLGHAHVDAGNYATLRRVTAPYREGDGEDA